MEVLDCFSSFGGDSVKFVAVWSLLKFEMLKFVAVWMVSLLRLLVSDVQSSEFGVWLSCRSLYGMR